MSTYNTMRSRWLWRRAVQIVLLLLLTLLYNEFIVYYLVLVRCDWPTLSSHDVQHESVRAMFISDPHLLGPSGHWWDRLRREWQMQRAFQTSLQLHSPELVFILGDLFDDGKWSSDAAFQADVGRFRKMFKHPDSVKLMSIIGNHDVGFHYMIDSHKLERFVGAVNSSDSVVLVRHKDITFITANSMAFEGDGCTMCRKAQKDLAKIASKLECAKNQWKESDECGGYEDKFNYSPPILLQHFPMYRPSDELCNGVDAIPEEYKYDKFREKFDCLSKEASQHLMDSVNPRFIISGHTHYFCVHKHNNGVQEWSVPSFSWRNHKGPSFLMVTLTSDDHAVSKCFMPNENTVYFVYFSVITLASLYMLFSFVSLVLLRQRKRC